MSFPLAEKVEVNGEGRHPLYAALVTAGYDDATVVAAVQRLVA